MPDSLLTDEARAMIGVTSEPGVHIVDRSQIRLFAESIGDSNPLYYDEEYARSTHWGGIVGPPTFVYIYKTGEMPEIPLNTTRLLNGGDEFEFFDPVRAGSVGYASYRFSFDSTRPEAEGARVAFDGIGRFDLEGDRIRRYSEVFDRGMALAQQAFEGERLRKIGLKYANALKARSEWQMHL